MAAIKACGFSIQEEKLAKELRERLNQQAHPKARDPGFIHKKIKIASELKPSEITKKLFRSQKLEPYGLEK